MYPLSAFAKALLTLIVTCVLIIAFGYLVFLLIVWAAAQFSVPYGIVDVIGFIIALVVIYNVVTRIWAFLEARNKGNI